MHRNALRLLPFVMSAMSACVVGEVDGGGGGGGGGGGDITQGQVQGTINVGGTWSGQIRMTGDTTIAAGTQVTIAAGTAFEAVEGSTLRVFGALTILGTDASAVSLLPVASAAAWAGIVVEGGGTLTASHVTGTHVANLAYCKANATCSLDHLDFTDVGKALTAEGTVTLARSRIQRVANGGITVSPGGSATITDSTLLESSGDIVIQSGGALVIEHSEIGGAAGVYEHCNIHIGAADSVRVTRSNIHSAVYGLMIGGTNGAVFQHNNWYGNSSPTNPDVDPVGINQAGNFRNNYWELGAPVVEGIDTSQPVAARIADAGPRP